MHIKKKKVSSCLFGFKIAKIESVSEWNPRLLEQPVAHWLPTEQSNPAQRAGLGTKSHGTKVSHRDLHSPKDVIDGV